MATAVSSGSFNSTVSPTNHPLVARYTITVPDGSQVSIQFGLDSSTQLGLSRKGPGLKTRPGPPTNIRPRGILADHDSKLMRPSVKCPSR